ncbi:GH36-type glycosyl hydrolase domain-containing protein [uncultured Cohaesibacter sp.]|uniref:GH36-type glycosyl hydrolase domain-containing protein n=1 Tax=uncultured Cohaesibacter sp. TaxID=1002546 RepID=UPI00292E0D91|nr:glucoamylase family protein [uncultured Cohaesibacter sp.]
MIPLSFLANLNGRAFRLWRDTSPIREELFSAERLELHAKTLAVAQVVSPNPPRVPTLQKRLKENANAIHAAYLSNAEELENHQNLVPAAEWLLDNYYLVDEQIRAIKSSLPPSYYQQLPKLIDGPLAGYPRVFGIAWAFVAHTDSHFDPEIFLRFIRAYQTIHPLTMGELWALPITLRIVLIENLRRLADQIVAGRNSRIAADTLVDQVLMKKIASDVALAEISSAPLPERFAAQLAKRLREHDTDDIPILAWLEERLSSEGCSIDEVVLRSQQNLGASNLTVRNIITSMRLISGIEWSEAFESVNLVDAELRKSKTFSLMDFATRDMYRDAIEVLARRSPISEIEVTRQVMALVSSAGGADSQDSRLSDPGYYLLSNGRPLLETKIDFKPPKRLSILRFSQRLGVGGYVGLISCLALMMLWACIWALNISSIPVGILLCLAGFIPATEVSTAFVNRFVTWSFGAVILPSMEFDHGVSIDSRTMVVVPTMLSNSEELLRQIEHLEIHYLSGPEDDLTFALLLDRMDADQKFLAEEDAMIADGETAIEQLNKRYGAGVAGKRFLLLVRDRQFNASEGKWMGWERKRGKLQELNQLLRGAKDTTFNALDGTIPWVPDQVRYVITMDADTRLPRDAARKLIGKMAHPLNRPIFDKETQRIIHGYGILQPRVTPTLTAKGKNTLFHRVFSSPGGIDPYSSAISDVYQDLFGEGSYTGKGIYDVDAFEAALANRIPENTVLSHDLLEGIFVRSGLVSDIEVIDDFPSRYDVACKRQDRWARGDWQLLPWILAWHSHIKSVDPIGFAKILDNLRRSLVAPTLLACLGLVWMLPFTSALLGTCFVLCAMAIPEFVSCFFAVIPRNMGIRINSHFRMLGAEFNAAAIKTILSLVFLPHQAAIMGRAIIKSVTRLYVTHSHMLQWVTAAQAELACELKLSGFYRLMIGGTVLGLVMITGLAVLSLQSLLITGVFACFWLIAPLVAFQISHTSDKAKNPELSPSEKERLRTIARRTWRYFERFVTPADNMLPPDNFQEDPKPVIAHRTSPTNIGLYLLSASAAYDFGWAGKSETIERLEACFETLRRMERFRGHFFNWYDTTNLKVLEPAYVSTVDSGNLAGHLIALSKACAEWRADLPIATVRMGMNDTLMLALEAFETVMVKSASTQRLGLLYEELKSGLNGDQGLEVIAPRLGRIARKSVVLANELSVIPEKDRMPDLVYWTTALANRIREFERDHSASPEVRDHLSLRLDALADEARAMALAMDFTFLFVQKRKLLSIGYARAENKLDENCYDLLASEANLASFVAIAKGDIPTRHWFRLGRQLTPVKNGAALISWSGSMFEYLMPSLVMQAPADSLLNDTNHRIVALQQGYGRKLNLPWGISESAFNARDIEFTYQYSNFGVPGLGLKRGLSENRVIAPYATGLAAMFDARNASINYDRIADMGGCGPYGFYEALDFTQSRLPDGQKVAIVRNVMAHHQGMTIVAIANVMHDGLMRSRFHSDPLIMASELLLQERRPRYVSLVHPGAEEVKASTEEAISNEPTIRCFKYPLIGAPITHLLSNGSYSVMLTARGAGYSRWGEIAITRWSEDSTRENFGSFIFLKDVDSGSVWSPAGHLVKRDLKQQQVIFAEDYGEYSCRNGLLTYRLDVLVSGEDDGEVRRITLSNTGLRSRHIELTSYSELVLASPVSDAAHPVFSKMFVETEYLPEFGGLLANRRRRSPDDPEIWVCHFAIVEGEIAQEPQYETDRLKFLGRNRSLANAKALNDKASLSNTTGTVLDPIFSLRHRVNIAPGETLRVTFWTLVAASRSELMNLLDKHHDHNSYDRAKTLSWTQAQVQLRHLNVSSSEAADFQSLASALLYSDSRFRASASVVASGAGRQSALWPLSISGDLPIVLLRISDLDGMPLVRQLLRAYAYWRMKGLHIDLIILNDLSTSYIQDLQSAIKTAMRSSQIRNENEQGSVLLLRSDQISLEAKSLLISVARASLVANHGSLSEQLGRIFQSDQSSSTTNFDNASLTPVTISEQDLLPQPTDLEFFNGIGGFDKDGTEYVITMKDGDKTPAPWINVIANPHFGFQVSETGSGYCWAENSRENQLTPWSNDPVADPAGEAVYIRDEENGAVWCPTAQPIRDKGTYITRHGFGYSRFEHAAGGIHSNLVQFVPLSDPIRISKLTLTNRSNRRRHLSVTLYNDWVLGSSRAKSEPFILNERDEETGALFATKPWNTAFPDRVAFADFNGLQQEWTADRTGFIGRNSSLAHPEAMRRKNALSGAMGACLDPCAAQRISVVLEPGESHDFVSLFGQSRTRENAREIITRYRASDIDACLNEVQRYWKDSLGAVQVKTPDRAMDIMLNGWLLYQTQVCRIWARSGFYQASGAYGFRDQMQDHIALTFSQPEETRKHLLLAAGRQFVEGDVQHWWLPHSGQGVRTHISDDRVWLAFATATYIVQTGDEAILDEEVPFLDGPLLAAGTHDAFFVPEISDETGSLFEHCARALDLCLALTGENGLPLIGTGDWNDGMNRVGEAGKGTSVWLSWLLLRSIYLFVPIAQHRDLERAKLWTSHATSLLTALENIAWDGEWYRRATFDSGVWLGSAASEECKIDSIAQSWAVLSGAADGDRARVAMHSLEQHLVLRDEGLALLFTPPFDQSASDPGYIKGYPPGLRENGGQYTHAAMWAILAFAQLDEGEKSHSLLALVNPINHALTPEATERYKVEPYVIAADVYSVAPHVGRGGWTWYTGSAGWMYQAGISGILGLRREGKTLTIAPCIPRNWRGFELRVRVDETDYDIAVSQTYVEREGRSTATLDGKPYPAFHNSVSLRLDGENHRLQFDLQRQKGG